MAFEQVDGESLINLLKVGREYNLFLGSILIVEMTLNLVGFSPLTRQWEPCNLHFKSNPLRERMDHKWTDSRFTTTPAEARAGRPSSCCVTMVSNRKL